MAQAIPVGLENSPTIKYVTSKGWNWQGGDGGQIQVEECPYCHKKGFKFYICVQNPEEGTRDGLFICYHGSCQKTGNLRTLQEYLGDRIPGVESRKEWAAGGDRQKQDELPNPDTCHGVLLGDAEVLDYLLNVRGFTQEIIDRQKLGVKESVKFRDAGTQKALVIPYLVNGNITFAKYRTVPPCPIKDFVTPFMGTDFDVPLYNGEILESLDEVIFVEGEANVLSLMSHGVENAIGIPGAGVRKANWIETIDKMPNLRIYILYDNDKAGSKGAQELASRIGIERCLKVVLPPFKCPDTKCKLCMGAGRVGEEKCSCWRDGKDIAEWFRWGGGSKEELEELKRLAQQFDVTGVAAAGDAISLLEAHLCGKTDLAPTYVTQYPSLNRLVGFENGDVIDILGPEKQGKTTFGLNIVDHMVEQYEEDGLIICLEMTHERLARKHVAYLTGFADDVTEPGTPEAKAKLEELIKCCAMARERLAQRKADLYFAYPQNYKNPEDIFKLIRDCIRRYGVKWVMFDNLQLLCDNTLANQAHRTVHLSQISKGFAKLAKDFGIKLIRILQPRQIEDGQIIRSGHTDGSSQIRKDCDCLLTIWRNPCGEIRRAEWAKDTGVSESTESFEPRMRVGLDLSRYSSGGHCTLYFDGARSMVREYTEQERKGRPQVNYNEVIVQEPNAPAASSVPSVSIPTEGITI